MDLTKKASCGIDKCFFRSLQNETIGYLVAGGSQFQYMEDAHELAISIQKEFDAKHFSLENARKIEVTETFQNLLNELVYQANRDLEVCCARMYVYEKIDYGLLRCLLLKKKKRFLILLMHLCCCRFVEHTGMGATTSIFYRRSHR